MRQLKIGKSITVRGGAVDGYLRDIANLGMITPDEEVELALRVKAGDESARNQLIEANLRFVVSVAKQYQGHGMELTDLINEGNIGLMRAVQKFDATRGIKFISYAVWWVRQQILQAISEQSRMVRLPQNQIGLISKLNSQSAFFQQSEGREPSAEELAQITGIPVGKVRTALGLSGRHVSLDSPLGEDDDAGTLLDVKADENSPAADETSDRESLSKEIGDALLLLTPRERNIVKWAFGIGCSEMTLDEIGDRLDLTRERVRQVKDKAVRKLSRSQTKEMLRQYL